MMMLGNDINCDRIILMAPTGKKKIPMLDLAAQHERIGTELERAVLAVMRSQQFILGPEVRELEGEIASYCGVARAVGCASGSDALMLALMALGIGEGDEVITTPFSFFATAGSIVRLGARVVFVDVDHDSFNINPDLIEAAISSKTKAIMPVHLFGQCAKMAKLLEAARANGIAVIEDAAQAIGASYEGTRAGAIGDIGAFSFYPSKNLGGAGDGGILTTNDGEIADKLSWLRAHGARKKYYHDLVGVNSRLDSIQAAILRVKLRYLDDWSRARRENASRYGRLFEEYGLLDSEKVMLPKECVPGVHVYNQFVIRAEDRDNLKSYLQEEGIGTEIYYPVPLHLQECFTALGYKQGDMPEAERASGEALAIPIYPELSAESQEYIVDRIASFY
jgi:dTDP-4-amino-4,6-dideoxygalactose transaminase